MDYTAVFALILKAVSVITALVEAGQEIAPAVKVITDLILGAQTGTVTDQQLTDTESTLDAMIADFNLPMV